MPIIRMMYAKMGHFFLLRKRHALYCVNTWIEACIIWYNMRDYRVNEDERKMRIEKKAYAKINLVLDVLFKRPDGMHEIDMIMTSLTLHDTLTFTVKAERDITLTMIDFEGDMEDNLIYKAAKLVQETWNIQTGAEITLTKRIPVAAGLAGGSSDAAATILAVCDLWDIQPTQQELETVAKKIGADVPYCLYHQTARVQGIGEVVRRIAPMPKTHVVLFKPNYGVSTAEAYARVSQEELNHYNVDAMESALLHSDYDEICKHVGNSFEKTAYTSHPELLTLKEELKAYADAVLLSGSGPTLFAVTKNTDSVKSMIECGRKYQMLAIQTETR